MVFIDISAVCLFLFLKGSDICSYSAIILHCQPCDVCPQCSARFLPAQSPLPVQCSLLVCPGSVLSPPTSHVSAGLFTRTSETGKGCARSHGSSESSRDTAYVVRPWVLHAQASSPWPPAHPQLSSDGWYHQGNLSLLFGATGSVHLEACNDLPLGLGTSPEYFRFYSYYCHLRQWEPFQFGDSNLSFTH